MAEAILAISLIKLPMVLKLTGLGKSNLYQKMQRGIFPRPVALGERAVAWRSDEIQKWIETRPRVELEDNA